MQGTLVDEREMGSRTGGGGKSWLDSHECFLSLSPSRVGITYRTVCRSEKNSSSSK